jgi:molybdenum cofactor cytidylyltransferase
LKKIRLNHCAIVLLAAGMSVRLGSPKQVLVYEGKTLLRHSVEAALGTGMQPVLVVLGANRNLLEKELETIAGIRTVINNGWQEGMASSIRCGVEAALQLEPGLEGLIIMVCDQPFVSTSLLEELFQTQQKTEMPAVASSYRDNPGVPALFHKSFFNELLTLKGDSGARKLLKDQADRVALVPFPKGETDIDTMNDYMELKELKGEGRND